MQSFLQDPLRFLLGHFVVHSCSVQQLVVFGMSIATDDPAGTETSRPRCLLYGGGATMRTSGFFFSGTAASPHRGSSAVRNLNHRSIQLQHGETLREAEKWQGCQKHICWVSQSRGSGCLRRQLAGSERSSSGVRLAVVENGMQRWSCLQGNQVHAPSGAFLAWKKLA